MSAAEIRSGLFTTPPDPRLLAGLCGSCGEHHFPAAEICPYCGSDDVSSDRVGATGVIYLHTIVNTAPPGYEGPVPYGFGLVDLPEGLRIVTRLVADDLGTLREGLPVELVVEPLFQNEDGDAVLSWAYAPAGERR